MSQSVLSKTQVLSLLSSIDHGQPFTVVFTKKDGSKRVLLASMEDAEGRRSERLWTVWDREAMRPKSFRLDCVHSISIP
jgi:hypothetical protein